MSCVLSSLMSLQDPSFHVSLAWCVGNMTGQMKECLQELQVNYNVLTPVPSLNRLVSACETSLRNLSTRTVIIVHVSVRTWSMTMKKDRLSSGWTARNCAAGRETKPSASLWNEPETPSKQELDGITDLYQVTNQELIGFSLITDDELTMCCL